MCSLRAFKFGKSNWIIFMRPLPCEVAGFQCGTPPLCVLNRGFPAKSPSVLAPPDLCSNRTSLALSPASALLMFQTDSAACCVR